MTSISANVVAVDVDDVRAGLCSSFLDDSEFPVASWSLDSDSVAGLQVWKWTGSRSVIELLLLFSFLLEVVLDGSTVRSVWL